MHGGGGGGGRRLVVVVAAVVAVHHPEGDVHLLLLLPQAAAARHGGERSERPVVDRSGDHWWRPQAHADTACAQAACVCIYPRDGRSEALGIRFDSGPGGEG